MRKWIPLSDNVSNLAKFLLGDTIICEKREVLNNFMIIFDDFVMLSMIGEFRIIIPSPNMMLNHGTQQCGLLN